MVALTWEGTGPTGPPSSAIDSASGMLSVALIVTPRTPHDPGPPMALRLVPRTEDAEREPGTSETCAIYWCNMPSLLSAIGTWSLTRGWRLGALTFPSPRLRFWRAGRALRRR